MHLAAFQTGPIATARRFGVYLRGLRRWCEKSGRDTAALSDADLAEWVSSVRASTIALRITLAAVSKAYAARGLPCPIGERTHSAVRLRLSAAHPVSRRRRRLTQRVAA